MSNASTVPLGFLPEDTEIVPYHDNDGRRVVLPVDLLSTFPNKCVSSQPRFCIARLKLRPGRPFGLTFAGRGNDESALLKYAYAFEQATQARKLGKTYAAATPKTQLVDIVSQRQQS